MTPNPTDAALSRAVVLWRKALDGHRILWSQERSQMFDRPDVRGTQDEYVALPRADFETLRSAIAPTRDVASGSIHSGRSGSPGAFQADGSCETSAGIAPGGPAEVHGGDKAEGPAATNLGPEVARESTAGASNPASRRSGLHAAALPPSGSSAVALLREARAWLVALLKVGRDREAVGDVVRRIDSFLEQHQC